MPTVTKQYRKIVLEVEFELSSSEANAGWQVVHIDDPPWEMYDAGITQEEIDAECLPDPF